jgi:hypothetical protein
MTVEKLPDHTRAAAGTAASTRTMCALAIPRSDPGVAGAAAAAAAVEL